MVYPFMQVWICIFLYVLVSLRWEYKLFKYTAIPFMQLTGGWKILSREWLPGDVWFTFMFSAYTCCSIASLISMVTPSLFSGTVFSRHELLHAGWENDCGEEYRRVVWAHVVNTSPTVKMLFGQVDIDMFY